MGASVMTQGAYGQVYLCGGTGLPGDRKWRGVLMDETHKEVWVGRTKDDPDKAMKDMRAAAKKLKIDDLRAWSGTL